MRNTTTISIRLKVDELKDIEEYANSAGMNRNAYIRTTLANKQENIPPALLCTLRHIQSILCEYDGELTEDMKKHLKGDIDTVCTMLLK